MGIQLRSTHWLDAHAVICDISRRVGIPLQSAVRFWRDNRKKLPGTSFAGRADGVGFFRALRQEALITAG